MARCIRHPATILILILMLTAGCTPHSITDGNNGPDRGDDASQGATFFVTSAPNLVGRVGKIVTNGEWKVPLTADFSFQVCMIDRSTSTRARGQRFEVEDPQNHRRIATDGPSSEQGCITWHDEVPFNYYARRSGPVEYVRRIVGTGVHSGYNTVRFAVDPWAVGDDARDQKIPPIQFLKDVSNPPTMVRGAAVDAFLSGQTHGGAGIFIKKIKISGIDRRDFADGSDIDYKLSFEPKVEYLNNDELPGFQVIKSGQFEIFADLIATDTGPAQSQKLILTQPTLHAFASVKDGEVLATLSTRLVRKVPIGNYALVIKMVPVGFGGSRPLQMYEGIFELGDVHKEIEGGDLAESCIVHLPSCNFDEFERGSNNFEALRDRTDDPYAFDNSRLSFSTLRLRFVTVAVTPPESATQRTVSYSASTCITDRNNGSKMDRMPFHLQYVDDDGNPLKSTDAYQNQTLTTDGDGCLHWLAHVWHQYYKPEEFQRKTVRLTMGETGAGTTLSFVLNPWDDKFTFGFDTRELSKDFLVRAAQRKKIESRFFTGGYGYHTIRFLYSFDQFMSLQVRKTILLEVDPRVLRYSGIVNARRTTEGLRDGIYLLKVAVQKNFFDPSAAGLQIYADNRDATGANNTSTSKEIPQREYITTATQLVRVVDGRLIKPMELTMRDLRLMRMRTNFLIELETVDEQLLSLNNDFQDDYLQEIRKHRDRFKTGPENENLNQDQRQQKIDEATKATQVELKKTWDQFLGILKILKASDYEEVDLKDFSIPDRLLKPIADVMTYNDFTTTKLPTCENGSCEQFVEKDTGLEPRTFVGPMIFLENAYSDAVRPTDNLDDTCHRPDNPFEFGDQSEKYWFAEREANEEKTKRNKYYLYNNYYGALTHLCDKSVDWLIERERQQNELYEQEMPKFASLTNFVKMNNTDFLPLNGKNVTDYPSTENTAKVVDILADINTASSSMVHLARAWTADDLRTLFFGADARDKDGIAHLDLQKESQLNFDQEETKALCNLLTNRFKHEFVKFHPQNDNDSNPFNREFSNLFGRNSPFVNPENFVAALYGRCVRRINATPSSVFLDSRLKVMETGPNYIFDGSFSININVGDGFSVGTSTAYSKSTDVVDFTDSLIGLAALLVPGGKAIQKSIGAAVLIHALHPFSGKGSASLGDSDDTSVTSQAYLVAQIAKFNVELTKYERCRTFKFDSSILDTTWYIDFPGADPAFQDETGRALGDVLSRGISVCEGIELAGSLSVPENYYYFTQHFTEGDMLDKADLLNHPWLLPLRGDRDFASFMRAIRAQEAVSPDNLGYGIGKKPTLRPLAWPLAQLANTYSQRAPSFPGFYTILPEAQRITNFPINERFINIKRADINGEMCSDPKGCSGMPIQSSPLNQNHTNSIPFTPSEL